MDNERQSLILEHKVCFFSMLKKGFASSFILDLAFTWGQREDFTFSLFYSRLAWGRGRGFTLQLWPKPPLCLKIVVTPIYVVCHLSRDSMVVPLDQMIWYLIISKTIRSNNSQLSLLRSQLTMIKELTESIDYLPYKYSAFTVF